MDGRLIVDVLVENETPVSKRPRRAPPVPRSSTSGVRAGTAVSTSLSALTALCFGSGRRHDHGDLRAHGRAQIAAPVTAPADRRRHGGAGSVVSKGDGVLGADTLRASLPCPAPAFRSV